MMPSDDLLLPFQDQFRIREHWRHSGVEYQKTAEAWLSNLDLNREKALVLFVEAY
jgi:cyclopropane-fatty-acyl-phospholipid synthase